MSGRYERVGYADGFYPFFTMGELLAGTGAVPYAMLAVDAAQAYGSVGVAWGLMATMLAACLGRVWWGRTAEGGGWIEALDAVAIPVVVCNGMAWGWMQAGATVLTTFLSLSCVRLARDREDRVVVIGMVCLVVAALICATMGVGITEPEGRSRWVTEVGFSAVPMVILPLLLATRQGDGMAEAAWVEAGWVWFLFLASGRLWSTDGAAGIHFAVFRTGAGLGLDVARVVAYIGLVVVVYGSLVEVIRKKEERSVKIMALEGAVLCQGWASLILLPLLSLSPFAVFPLAVLSIRAVRFFVVYKWF